MEVSVIDWKSIDSRFVKDEAYEHINAPKWVDFSAPDDHVDDEAWFCRPGCDHPKTVEDFLKKERATPTSNSKLQKSASVHNIPPMVDRNKRGATLKKRGINQPSALSSKEAKYHRIVEDGENQDPNFSTPLNHKAKVGTDAVKSSAERGEISVATTREQTPKLRSTLSARNLFSGGDLLSKVAEFCNELKQLAIRAKDKENAGDGGKQEDAKDQDRMGENTGVLTEKEKVRKPLLEVGKERSEVMETCGSKRLQRKKIKKDDAENTPISVDVKKIKQQDAEGLLQIRTCPPTPQCFSAGHGPPKTTSPKPFRSRPLNQERGILQELKQNNKEGSRQDYKEQKTNQVGGGEAAEKEAKPLDVFWFLKLSTERASASH